jgi:hypothetical protein
MYDLYPHSQRCSSWDLDARHPRTAAIESQIFYLNFRIIVYYTVAYLFDCRGERRGGNMRIPAVVGLSALFLSSAVIDVGAGKSNMAQASPTPKSR